jgi:hypothetical protein
MRISLSGTQKRWINANELVRDGGTDIVFATRKEAGDPRSVSTPSDFSISRHRALSLLRYLDFSTIQTFL